MLDERGRGWQDRFGRLANDLPARERQLDKEEIQEVELWDLVSAFGRIMRDAETSRPSSIVYDETPIHVYMAQIQGQLLERGRVAFRELFHPGMSKSALVGIFLAILELVRHQQARAEQNQMFGEIWVLPGPTPAAPLDASRIDTYEHGRGP
jgi:segregation and condensation protein A